MILALTSAAVLAAAAPEAPAQPAPKPAAATPAAHGPPLAGGPSARRGPCDRLDAAETPACADQARQAPLAPQPASPRKADPSAAPKPGLAAPKASAPHAPPKAVRKPAPFDTLIGAVERNPLATGAGVGGALLLVGLGGWALFGRRGAAAPAAGRVRGGAPTPFRRDLVLIDGAGQGRRLAGPALTPFAWAGAHARDHMRLEGDGVAPRHVQFWVEEGRLMLRRAAADPVFLNDRLLKDATAEVVSTGDRLQLGRASFRILID